MKKPIVYDGRELQYAEPQLNASRDAVMLEFLTQFITDERKQRFEEVQRKLRIQARDAVWWRDACLLYFQTFSNRPIPQDMEHPVHNLDEMMKFKIRITMYENPECGYTK
jgi:hypothetical protein